MQQKPTSKRKLLARDAAINEMSVQLLNRIELQDYKLGKAIREVQARGVLPKKLGRGVRPASQNPYPIYDQNRRFSIPYL